jgi:hypothetical protein
MQSEQRKKPRFKKRKNPCESLRIDQSPSQRSTDDGIEQSADRNEPCTQGVEWVILSNVGQCQRDQVERDQNPKDRIFGLKQPRDFHEKSFNKR